LTDVVTACAAAGAPIPDGTLELRDRVSVELARPRPGRLDVAVWRQDGRWLVSDPVRALVALWATAPLPRR
jgi:hypothetical protein